MTARKDPLDNPAILALFLAFFVWNALSTGGPAYLRIGAGALALLTGALLVRHRVRRLARRRAAG
ncbi:hypothetical protein [Streptomyces yaizuensis]|uniref:EamA family transporter n=1 Tax=Streptomyces yaizuensis TaxID=2989713 RepID=A0ABQ5P9L5_9ACTN|nr:hypothetical protein [Streptomyces sp. YSPA8]GLF99273.1 hypothetical protein SYYSPA8_33270 [Streptomyces sp. YSPA8]